MQDTIERWYDMCKPFEDQIEVKSYSMIDTQAVDNIDCVQKWGWCDKICSIEYTWSAKQRLVQVSLKQACIHDFKFASLMMDICT